MSLREAIEAVLTIGVLCIIFGLLPDMRARIETLEAAHEAQAQEIADLHEKIDSLAEFLSGALAEERDR